MSPVLATMLPGLLGNLTGTAQAQTPKEDIEGETQPDYTPVIFAGVIVLGLVVVLVIVLRSQK